MEKSNKQESIENVQNQKLPMILKKTIIERDRHDTIFPIQILIWFHLPKYHIYDFTTHYYLTILIQKKKKKLYDFGFLLYLNMNNMTFLKEISCHALSDRQNPTDMQRSLRILSISYLSYCFPLFLYFFLINPFVSSQLIHLSAISNLYLLLKSSNFILDLSLIWLRLCVRRS